MPHYASASQRAGRRNSRTRHNRETHLRSDRPREPVAALLLDGPAGWRRLRDTAAVERVSDGYAHR